jgi:fumarylacetoacetase
VSDGFGLANLPFGIVAPRGEAPRAAVRLGDRALDLAAAQAEGLLRVDDLPDGVFAADALNGFLATGRRTWQAVRARVRELLEAGDGTLHDLGACDVLCPVAPGDYVDFYSSIEHATNLGRMFRPGSEPLLPNWKHLPVGYHGRSSTVVVSGTPVARPHGQRPPAEDGGAPTYGPSERLDIELELGFVTGGPLNALGEPLRIEDVREHVFGLVLVNDWSARDLQRWEYQPLGPFLGKSFATSISPWVVPLEALEPFRVAGPVQDPQPLPYLRRAEDWNLDIALEVELNGTVVSRTNARGLYWDLAQQLVHAAVNGTRIRPGDLYASGTISGPDRGTEGSFIELTLAGKEPMELGGGETRTFLRDGDEVVLRGVAGTGDAAVSLGEVRGRVAPGHALAE